MATKLIYDDAGKRTNYTNAWGESKTALQGVVTAYDALGLDPLTPAEFQQLFTDIDGLIFDKITGGTLSFGGVDINRSKALELVTKPAGYSTFLSTLNAYIERFTKQGWGSAPQGTMALSIKNIPNFFVLDGTNTVQYTASFTTKLADYGKVIATSDRVIAVHDFLEDVVAAFYANGLDNYYSGNIEANGSWTRLRMQGNAIESLSRLIGGIKHDDQSFVIDNPSLFTKQRIDESEM